LIESVASLNEKAALDEIRRRVKRGEDASKILGEAREGLRAVGERFNRKEYALIELEMADQLFRECKITLESLNSEESSRINSLESRPNDLKKDSQLGVD